MSRLLSRRNWLLLALALLVLCIAGSSAIAATINGGNGPDTLTGTAGNDTMNGDNGADTLKGLGGHDILNGGNGPDSLLGGAGLDLLMGDSGPDSANGEGDNDFLISDTNGSSNAANGGDGNDVVAGPGAASGDAGNDVLISTAKKGSALTGGAGTDTCYTAAPASASCENVVAITGTGSADPSLVQTSGPAEDAVVSNDDVTFNFSKANASKVLCMLETGAILDCTNGTVSFNDLPNGDHAVLIAAVPANKGKAVAAVVRHFSVNVSAVVPVLSSMSTPGADQLSITGYNLPAVDRLRLSLADGGQIVIPLPDPRVVISTTAPFTQKFVITDVNLGREVVTSVAALQGASTVVASLNGNVSIATSIDLQVAASPAANTLTVHGAHLDNMDFLVLMHDGGSLAINLSDSDVIVSEGQIIVTRAALGGLHVSQIDAVLAVDGMEVMDSLIVNITIAASDNVPPVLELPSTVLAEATSSAGADVSYSAAAVDAVDGTVAINCAPASGSTFHIGVTNVNCSAHDAAGNATSASFQVIVDDTTAPALTVPAAMTLQTDNTDGIAVNFETSASDAVSGNVAVDCSPASGSTLPLGVTLVECSATDAAGNTASAQFTVSVDFASSGTVMPTTPGGTMLTEGTDGPLGWSLANAPQGTTAEVMEDGIRFAGDPISVTYHSNDTMAKEAITVNEHQGTRTWTWNLVHPASVTPELTANGDVNFGEALILAPVILDADGNVVDGGAYELNGSTLSLTFDDGAYPLPYTIDPTLLYDLRLHYTHVKLGTTEYELLGAGSGAAGSLSTANGASSTTTVNNSTHISGLFCAAGNATCSAAATQCKGALAVCEPRALVSGSLNGATKYNLSAFDGTGADGGFIYPMDGKTLPPSMAMQFQFRVNVGGDVAPSPADGKITAEYRLFKVKREANGTILPANVTALGDVQTAATPLTGLTNGLLVNTTAPALGTYPTALYSDHALRSFGTGEDLLVMVNVQLQRTSKANAAAMSIALRSSVTPGVNNALGFPKVAPPKIVNVTNTAVQGLESQVANGAATSSTTNTVKWTNLGGAAELVNGSLYSCTLNGAPLTPCDPTGTVVTGFGPGDANTLTVKATNAGNVAGTWSDGTSQVANTSEYTIAWTKATGPSLRFVSFKNSQGGTIANGGTNTVGDGTVVPVIANDGGVAASYSCYAQDSLYGNYVYATGPDPSTICDPAALVGMPEGDYTLYVEAYDETYTYSSFLQRNFKIKRAPVAAIEWQGYNGNVVVAGNAPGFGINWGPVNDAVQSYSNWQYGTPADATTEFSSECQVDNEGWEPCYDAKFSYMPSAFYSLGEGLHTLKVKLTRFGVGTDSIGTYAFQLVNNPQPVFFNEPADSANVKLPATIDWRNDGGAYDTAQCYIDWNPIASCSHPISFAGLSEGPHELSVQLSHSVYGSYGTASYNFTVRVAPIAQVTSYFGNEMASGSYAAFDIQATNTTNVDTAECRLNAGAVLGTWEPCNGPLDWQGHATHYIGSVPAGVYTFEARLTNGVGSSTASHAFTAYGEPQLQWNTTPNVNASTPNVSATWSNVGAAPQGTLTYTCKLDSVTITPCAGSFSRTALDGGPHTLDVRAEDQFGRTSDLTHSFFVVPVPQVFISHNRPEPSEDGSGQFALTTDVEQSQLTSTKCAIDAEALRPCDSATTENYSGLTPGSHTMKAQFATISGSSAVKTFTWTIIAPSVTFRTNFSGAVLPSGTTGYDIDASSAPANSLTSAQCRLVRAGDPVPAFAACQFSDNSSAGNHLPAMTAGSYSFDVKFTNNAASTTGSYAFTVVGAPSLAWVTQPAATNNGNTSATWVNNGALPQGTVTTTCALDFATVPCTTATSKTLTGLAQGSHYLTVTATDQFHRSSQIVTSFQVVSAPAFTITHSNPATSEEPAGYFDLNADTMPSDLTSAQCAIDAEALRACDTLTRENYAGLGAGTHTFKAQLSSVGGSSPLQTYTWTVVAPVLTFETSWGTQAQDLSPFYSVTIKSGAAHEITAAQCRVIAFGQTAPAFTNCTSGPNNPASHSLGSLPAGQYTLEAKVTNPVATATGTFAFTVVGAPSLAWVATPADPNNGSINATWANNGPLPQGTVTTTCTLDSATVPCTTATSLVRTGLASGYHFISVKAVDQFGRSSELTGSFRVVQVPVVGVQHSNNVPTTNHSGSFTLFSTNVQESDLTSVQCAIDAEAMRPCDAVNEETYSNLASGSHTLKVQMSSVSGTSPVYTYSWVIADPLTLSMDAGWHDSQYGSFLQIWDDVENGATDVDPQAHRNDVRLHLGDGITDPNLDVAWKTEGTIITQTCTLYDNPSGQTLTNPVNKPCPHVDGPGAVDPQTLVLTNMPNGPKALSIKVQNGLSGTAGNAEIIRYFTVGQAIVPVTLDGPIQNRARVADYHLDLNVPEEAQFMYCRLDYDGLAMGSQASYTRTTAAPDGLNSGDQICTRDGVDVNQLTNGKHSLTVWVIGPASGTGLDIQRSDLEFDVPNSCHNSGMSGTLSFLNNDDGQALRNYTLNTGNCDTTSLADTTANMGDMAYANLIPNETDKTKLGFVDPSTGVFGVLNADGSDPVLLGTSTQDLQYYFEDFFIGNKFYVGETQGVPYDNIKGDGTLTEYVINPADNTLVSSRVIFDTTTTYEVSPGDERQFVSLENVDRNGTHGLFAIKSSGGLGEFTCYGPLSDPTQCNPVQPPFYGKGTGDLINGVMYTKQVNGLFPGNQTMSIVKVNMTTGVRTTLWESAPRTSASAAQAIHGWPVVSPNGQKIAWTTPVSTNTAENTQQTYNLMVMNIDGSGQYVAAVLNNIAAASNGAFQIGNPIWNGNGVILFGVNHYYTDPFSPTELRRSFEIHSVAVTGSLATLQVMVPDGFIPRLP